jgi:predicted DNA-binding protein (UPF0278 family)
MLTQFVLAGVGQTRPSARKTITDKKQNTNNMQIMICPYNDKKQIHKLSIYFYMSVVQEVYYFLLKNQCVLP